MLQSFSQCLLRLRKDGNIDVWTQELHQQQIKIQTTQDFLQEAKKQTYR